MKVSFRLLLVAGFTSLFLCAWVIPVVLISSGALVSIDENINLLVRETATLMRVAIERQFSIIFNNGLAIKNWTRNNGLPFANEINHRTYLRKSFGQYLASQDSQQPHSFRKFLDGSAEFVRTRGRDSTHFQLCQADGFWNWSRSFSQQRPENPYNCTSTLLYRNNGSVVDDPILELTTPRGFTNGPNWNVTLALVGPPSSSADDFWYFGPLYLPLATAKLTFPLLQGLWSPAANNLLMISSDSFSTDNLKGVLYNLRPVDEPDCRAFLLDQNNLVISASNSDAFIEVDNKTVGDVKRLDNKTCFVDASGVRAACYFNISTHPEYELLRLVDAESHRQRHVISTHLEGPGGKVYLWARSIIDYSSTIHFALYVFVPREWVTKSIDDARVRIIVVIVVLIATGAALTYVILSPIMTLIEDLCEKMAKDPFDPELLDEAAVAPSSSSTITIASPSASNHSRDTSEKQQKGPASSNDGGGVGGGNGGGGTTDGENHHLKKEQQQQQQQQLQSNFSSASSSHSGSGRSYFSLRVFDSCCSHFEELCELQRAFIDFRKVIDLLRSFMPDRRSGLSNPVESRSAASQPLKSSSSSSSNNNNNTNNNKKSENPREIDSPSVLQRPGDACLSATKPSAENVMVGGLSPIQQDQQQPQEPNRVPSDAECDFGTKTSTQSASAAAGATADRTPSEKRKSVRFELPKGAAGLTGPKNTTNNKNNSSDEQHKLSLRNGDDDFISEDDIMNFASLPLATAKTGFSKEPSSTGKFLVAVVRVKMQSAVDADKQANAVPSSPIHAFSTGNSNCTNNNNNSNNNSHNNKYQALIDETNFVVDTIYKRVLLPTGATLIEYRNDFFIIALRLVKKQSRSKLALRFVSNLIEASEIIKNRSNPRKLLHEGKLKKAAEKRRLKRGNVSRLTLISTSSDDDEGSAQPLRSAISNRSTSSNRNFRTTPEEYSVLTAGISVGEARIVRMEGGGADVDERKCDNDDGEAGTLSPRNDSTARSEASVDFKGGVLASTAPRSPSPLPCRSKQPTLPIRPVTIIGQCVSDAFECERYMRKHLHYRSRFRGGCSGGSGGGDGSSSDGVGAGFAAVPCVRRKHYRHLLLPHAICHRADNLTLSALKLRCFYLPDESVSESTEPSLVAGGRGGGGAAGFPSLKPNDGDHRDVGHELPLLSQQSDGGSGDGRRGRVDAEIPPSNQDHSASSCQDQNPALFEAVSAVPCQVRQQQHRAPRVRIFSAESLRDGLGSSLCDIAADEMAALSELVLGETTRTQRK